MTTLLEKIHAVEHALATAAIPHGFGGALALAFCVGEPRATVDIDLNVFLPVDRIDDVLASLPDAVRFNDADRKALQQDGQARLWWETTPIDLFFSTSSFHDSVGDRVRMEDVGGVAIPILACRDLAVFKAFFNRRKDWADLEAMLAVHSFDLEHVFGVLARYLGPDDERLALLLEVSRTLP